MLSHARTRTESIQAAGIRLVLEGKTTLDEIIRVAGLGED
jgi:type II secretory ATPase GspE/PulE/Tfp pilus assembly ATPase PilB-like protein